MTTRGLIPEAGSDRPRKAAMLAALQSGCAAVLTWDFIFLI